MRDPADREIAALLARARVAVSAGRLILTDYAARRAAAELGWVREDVRLQILDLEIGDFHRAERGEPGLLWTFTPWTWDPFLEADLQVWIRLREVQLPDGSTLIVVSCHLA